MQAVWFDIINSTNEEARRRAEAGEGGSVWLAARVQTAGRGRQGRVWQGDSRNLTATYLSVFDQTPAQLATLSFVAALAVAETCDDFGCMPAPQLKWPNDVYINGAKAAGLLLESGVRGDGRIWLAMGIGLNLAAHPGDTIYPATHLGAHIATPPPAPEQALVVLDGHLTRWLTVWAQQGFDPVRTAWLKRAYGLHAPATARLATGDITGLALGIDETGALELKRESGEITRISAGEVFFA